MTVRVAAALDVAAPVEDVFAAMIDLPSQDRWILATSLFALEGDAEVPAVGSRIAALTGVGGIGVLDTMTVTVFEPPHRWETSHTGHTIKGIGIFTVDPMPNGSRVTWAEELDLPLGAIGRIGFKVVAPIVRWGLKTSLRRLATGVLDGSLPVGRQR
ncbi:Carbon monoxide dehydrogenase subunit G [Nakamurella panacisegetis]|uniref:Carbon monoxide dehydrogenase subunit G n=1 Tax=Nakamurella panacisegetis TaxID=1090615 RepID=A0A1H0SNN0_9ACTN|nr:SRPBCC family protein [Nakamurella panacisegetis]SDP42848.1 Carbon monoxide dehydrogenase subunit G [Nakamurella panacisegetis]